MAYPDNIDARIAQLEAQIELDLANGLNSPVVEILEKLKNIRQSTSSTPGGSGPTAAEIGTAVNGTPITGQTLETGGTGGTGWFSSLRLAITSRLGNITDEAASLDTSDVGLFARLKRINQMLTLATSGITTLVERPITTFNRTIQTNSTGVNFATLPNIAASEVTIENSSAVDIEWRYVGETDSLVIPAGMGRVIEINGNSNLVQIRRVDQSNTQATIGFSGVLR